MTVSSGDTNNNRGLKVFGPKVQSRGDGSERWSPKSRIHIIYIFCSATADG